ncbi:TIGR04211 family SH3 domain-containing protein [Pseudomaricurvus sp.]|uniref:TIGR04211 family SH3 domain-containing protein n=1 Tax=Pseudomaricurvus sp. TaxID=2004510 RepID=UPI003F6D29FA
MKKIATVKKITTFVASSTLTLGMTLGLALGVSTANAQEYRWVSDTLYVPLRSGKGNQYRILDKGMKSGTRLTVVSEDPEGGWTEVKTRSGEVGFVRSQFLINSPTDSLKLSAAEANLSKVEKQYNALKQQLGEARSTGSELDQELASANTRVNELETELAELKRVSADAISLNQRHQKLMHDHQVIQNELEVVKAENERLQSDERNTFFLYGAGAVLLGVIITLVAPAFRRRKSYSEWA